MTDVSGRTTATTTLNESGLDCRVFRRKPLPGEELRTEAWTRQKKKKESFEILLREARSRGVYSDEMETELSARKQSALSGGNWAQLITHLIALLPRSMVVAVSCCGGAFEQKGTADS